MREQNYFVKIIILFLATGAGIFALWYAVIREQSADWITEQVVHQASPYVVSTADNGRVLISNVLAGYEFFLPPGFKTAGARNLTFYLEQGDIKKCEIKHYRLRPAGSKLAEKDLVFELVNQEEKDVCGKYLSEIKNRIVVD